MVLDLRIEEACGRLGGPLRLVLHQGGEAPELAARLGETAAAVARAAGLDVEPGDGDGPPLLPALTLRGGHGAAIHFLAAPEGSEATPFAEALEALARAAHAADPAPRLDPAALQVLVAAGCPSCPRAVAAAVALAAREPLISVAVVDVAYFPEQARRLEVRSVPLTVLDDGFTLVGVHAESRLAAVLAARGGAGYAAALFASLIEAGRFGAAATRLCGGEDVLPFVRLWCESTTSSRIGLLLAVERALAEQPYALDAAVARLVEVLGTDDTTLRGDTADLLGRIGHPGAAAALALLRDDPHPDVAEIAAEALAQLRLPGA